MQPNKLHFFVYIVNTKKTIMAPSIKSIDELEKYVRERLKLYKNDHIEISSIQISSWCYSNIVNKGKIDLEGYCIDNIQVKVIEGQDDDMLFISIKPK